MLSCFLTFPSCPPLLLRLLPLEQALLLPLDTMYAKFTTLLFPLALAVSPVAYAAIAQKRASAFVNPAIGGGSMFIDAGNGFGEPLNVRLPEPFSHQHRFTD